ncbi:ATP-binding protein [Catenulispora sp. GP43]|uniref:ATP-binding protein n=1 Tax=Catenulispora sp. GP43 TaxID=3156263 RepID=UPI003517C1EC
MPNRLAPIVPVSLAQAEQRATVCREETSSLTLSLLPASPRWARRHAAEMLQRWNLPDVEWAVCQVVSELVTNAVAAAWHDGAERVRIVRLTLRLLPRRLYVEVFDAVPQLPKAREPSDEDEAGRGLCIVAALADAVEVRRERTGGKTVSAAFDLPAGHGAAAGAVLTVPNMAAPVGEEL